MTNYTKPSDTALIWSTTGVSSKPSDFNWNKGWEQVKPPFEEMNYIHKKHDSWVAYSNQKGVPEWDNGTIYYTTSYVQVAGSVYRSKTNSNVNNNPSTDLSETNWRLIFNGLNKLTSAADFTTFGKDFVLSADASAARTQLGVGGTGSQVFLANTQESARTAIGITSFGSNLITSSNISNGQTALGFSTYGKGVIDKNNGDATLTYLGLSTTGLIFVKSATNNSALATLGFTSLATTLVKQTTGDNMMSTMGITSTGRDIAKSASKSAAKSYLDVPPPATQEQTNIGTGGESYVKPSTLRFGFNTSFGTNGFIKFPSWMGGFTIQWARISVSDDGTATWTYPTAFANQAFVGFGTHAQSFDVTEDAGVGVYNMTTTTATIRNGSNGGGSSSLINLLALGW